MQIVFDTVHDTVDHIKHGIAVLCAIYDLPAHTPVVLAAPVPVPPVATAIDKLTVGSLVITGNTEVTATVSASPDQDNRDPSAVFGAAALGNGAPLPAGATPLPSAPGALPGGPPPPQSVGSLPAAPTTLSAPAPTTSAPPAASQGPALVHGVEIDKDGIPWDARIHANAAVKMADSGFWKKRKGLNDEAKVAAIKTELRQSMAAGGIPAAPAPVAAPPAAMVPPPPAATLLPAPPAGTITPNATPSNFAEMMPKIGAATNAGILNMNNVMDACTAHGLPNIPAMGSRPDLIPSIWTYLIAMFPALATI